MSIARRIVWAALCFNLLVVGWEIGSHAAPLIIVACVCNVLVPLYCVFYIERRSDG